MVQNNNGDWDELREPDEQGGGENTNRGLHPDEMLPYNVISNIMHNVLYIYTMGSWTHADKHLPSKQKTLTVRFFSN